MPHRMIAKLRQPLAPGAFGRFWRDSTQGTSTAPPTSCYALSTDGSIATSLLGHHATFPCGDVVETFHAISEDGSIAASQLGPFATFVH